MIVISDKIIIVGFTICFIGVIIIFFIAFMVLLKEMHII